MLLFCTISLENELSFKRIVCKIVLCPKPNACREPMPAVTKTSFVTDESGPRPQKRLSQPHGKSWQAIVAPRHPCPASKQGIISLWRAAKTSFSHAKHCNCMSLSPSKFQSGFFFAKNSNVVVKTHDNGLTFQDKIVWTQASFEFLHTCSNKRC